MGHYDECFEDERDRILEEKQKIRKVNKMNRKFKVGDVCWAKNNDENGLPLVETLVTIMPDEFSKDATGLFQNDNWDYVVEPLNNKWTYYRINSLSAEMRSKEDSNIISETKFSKEFLGIAETDNLGLAILKTIESGYSPYKMIEDLFYDLQTARNELIGFKMKKAKSPNIEVPFDSLPKELQDKIMIDRKKY